MDFQIGRAKIVERIHFMSNLIGAKSEVNAMTMMLQKLDITRGTS